MENTYGLEKKKRTRVFSMVIQNGRHNGFIQIEEMKLVLNAAEGKKYDGRCKGFYSPKQCMFYRKMDYIVLCGCKLQKNGYPPKPKIGSFTNNIMVEEDESRSVYSLSDSRSVIPRLTKELFNLLHKSRI